MSCLPAKNASEQVRRILTDSPLVIFCGGKGQRLREETEWKPKPMVQVGDYPLLWHIMRYYHCFGVRKFILCLGYKGQVIRDFFLNYHRQWADLRIQVGNNRIDYSPAGYAGDDWDILLVDTGSETKTGGRLAAVKKYLQEGDRFFLTYGDGLSDIDMYQLVQAHLDGKRTATVTAVRPHSRFGELLMDDQGKVLSFAEKPPVSDIWVNGGFLVCDKEIFDYVPDYDVFFEDGPLRELAVAGQLTAYQHHGFWQCVDTYRELVLVENLWNSNSAPWRLW